MSNLTDWMDKCHELEKLLAAAMTDRREQVRRKREGKAVLEKELLSLRASFNANAELHRVVEADLRVEVIRLKEWNQERAGQFAATEQRLASRIAVLENRFRWLHLGNSADAEGYEWGIYRVKWENGVAVSVMHTRSDLSDLDAEIAREEAKSP